MRAPTIILCTLAITTAALARVGPDKAQREAMLERGERAELIDWFENNPDEALLWIDSYLEGGLAMIEAGETMEKARASYDTGVALARLAHRAYDEPIFTRYAVSFTMWDEQERKQFREGQRLYREGTEALARGDAAGAIELHRRSLKQAEPLGDRWGIAMANAGIGRAALEAGDHAEAMNALTRAEGIYQKLRLRRSRAAVLADLARAMREHGLTRGAAETAANARDLLTPDDNPALRVDVLEETLACHRALGKNGDALLDIQRALDEARSAAEEAAAQRQE